MYHELKLALECSHCVHGSRCKNLMHIRFSSYFIVALDFGKKIKIGIKNPSEFGI